MMVSNLLKLGRTAFEQRSWREAYEQLSAADQEAPLEAEDLFSLALAATLTGRDEKYFQTMERAFERFNARQDTAASARCAFWLGFRLAMTGDQARGSGWLARAQRLLDSGRHDCVERGYLLLPQIERHMAAAEFDEAFLVAGRAIDVAQRFTDPELLSLALHIQGRIRIKQGRLDEGLALLDEAMVGVAEGSLFPPVTGVIYCGVIAACRSVYELRRAQEWTTAMSSWCERQENLVAFAGQCLVHRAELMQFHGAWQESLAEARRAWELCGPAGNGSEKPAAGGAFYQQGEVHRLLGEFDAAEAAYRQALVLGREPQPGLALLRLAQGNDQAALAGIGRALLEATDPLKRARLLPAQIEISLATGDLRSAQKACEELEAIARTYDTSVLSTLASGGRGEVELAAGNTMDALTALRRALRGWQEFGAPYEAARTRVAMSTACRALGDEDSADMELAAAKQVLVELGATPDLDRLEKLTSIQNDGETYGLTARETEVLRSLARGESNKAIAAELSVSVRTVHRHVSNIFAKIGVSSRSAATAFAFEHGIVQ